MARTLIDPETGEVVDEVVAVRYLRRTPNGFDRNRWFMMAQSPFEVLAAQRRELGADGFSVLFLLLARLDFDNHIYVSQKEMCAKLGMAQPNVSRAIHRLLDIGVIDEGPRVGRCRSYRLNPSYGWKGRPENHRAALKDRMRSARMKVVA